LLPALFVCVCIVIAVAASAVGFYGWVQRGGRPL
jgi:hypothetical protein